MKPNETTEETQATDARQAPIRVLIVDDMPQVRQDLRTVLALVGREAGIPIQVVGEAGDGQQAVERARDLHPEVVLMDLAMPVLDGYGATRAIKAGSQSTRVIILTVHSSPEAQAKATQAGADAFVEKGAPLNVLLQLILSHPDPWIPT